ncbi:hypothetical protein [Micromonospora sp. NPDC000668]|uniref:hypothetical protein n=1 Tax=Micromonospora sp. NPDC000668 TaxID=3364219 RepID=UPI0036AB7282
MLSVALTCPLWWVARWATRVLTSLAVVAALALGAGTSPASAYGLSAFSPGSVAPSGRPAPMDDTVHTTPIAAEEAAEQPSPTRSSDGQAAPLGGEAAVPADAAPVLAAGADRLPRADGPASRAPRAPPGR